MTMTTTVIDFPRTPDAPVEIRMANVLSRAWKDGHLPTRVHLFRAGFTPAEVDQYGRKACDILQATIRWRYHRNREVK